MSKYAPKEIVMKKLFQVIIVGILCTGFVTGQTVEYTKRNRNEVRQGPGNFYPLVLVLPSGVKIPVSDVSGAWVKFVLPPEAKKNIKGQPPDQVFLAKNCLEDKPPTRDVADLSRASASTNASPSARAAAIRGFGMRYGKATSKQVASLDAVRGIDFSAQEYTMFRQSMNPSSLSGLGRQFPRYIDAEYNVTENEIGIGMGVGARIAAQGLVDNEDLHKYLNMLATYLTEGTKAYDYRFHVYVINTNEVNAFSVPGGYVFFTLGMLKACKDESELAAVVGHEIMHIILKHGVKEIAARADRIHVDETFDELDKETKTEDSEEIQELEEYGLSVFENSVKHRTMKYEYEADAGASLLLAWCGYDPRAITRALVRISQITHSTAGWEQGPFAGCDFDQRNKEVTSFINRNLSNVRGVTNEARFQRYLK